MNKSIILFLILISAYSLQAQSDSTWRFKRKNNINIEALGSNVLYSINYERLILNKSRLKSFTTIGFSYAPYRFFRNTSNLQFVLNQNQLYSFSLKSHIEGGVGLHLYQSYNFEKFDFPTYFIFHIGYRYQNPNGKFIFKIEVAGSLNRIETFIYPSSGSTYILSFVPCAGFGYVF